MKNLYFLFAAFTSLGLGCSAPPFDVKSKTLPQFKNVLLIISDDHAAYALGCYGNEVIRTPHLDRMAQQGTRFERAYANSPVCTASRASFITGKYAHATYTTLLRTPLPESEITLADHLSPLGYATGSFGKNHFNSALKHGYDTLVNNREHLVFLDQHTPPANAPNIRVRPVWKPFRDHSRVWLNAEGATSGLPYELDQGTFFARSGIDFMRRHRPGPFLAVVSFREPHSPFNFPTEFQDKYDPADMPMPEVSKEDDRWIPAEFRDLTEAERRGIIRSYYSSVEYMDQNVGLLLDSLDAMGLRDSTLVVYIGDHGYLLNHHQRFEKHMMWEEAIRVPLIVRGIGSNAKVKDMVSLVDLVPSILELIGAPAKADVQGQSFVPLLKGMPSKHKNYIFSEYMTDNKAMVRTNNWKLIFTSGKADLGQGYITGKGPSGLQYRLYDMKNDPGEFRNVVDHPELKDTVAHLRTTLLNHFKTTHPYTSNLPQGLSVDEQLSWFCEPVEGKE